MKQNKRISLFMREIVEEGGTDYLFIKIMNPFSLEEMKTYNLGVYHNKKYKIEWNTSQVGWYHDCEFPHLCKFYEKNLFYIRDIEKIYYFKKDNETQKLIRIHSDESQ